MKEYSSKRIFDGYALGKLVVYQDIKTETKNEFLGEEKETERFIEARAKTIVTFEKLYQDTLIRLGRKRLNSSLPINLWRKILILKI